MTGVKGMKKTVDWNAETRELIMATVAKLAEDGMKRPPKRSVLYKLLDLSGWTKDHYNQLCRKTGEWQDDGLIPYGTFSDEVGGGRSRPHTTTEIARQLELWKEMVPAQLAPDGYLHALLVEHEAMMPQIQDWCDGQAVVVSSAGQIRRENLWTAVQEWKAVAKELKAKGIKAYAFVDYDKGGNDIFESHRRWFKKVAGLELVKWGLTDAQVRRLGLPIYDKHQVDGAIGRDPRYFRNGIRQLLGFQEV